MGGLRAKNIISTWCYLRLVVQRVDVPMEVVLLTPSLRGTGTAKGTYFDLFFDILRST